MYYNEQYITFFLWVKKLTMQALKGPVLIAIWSYLWLSGSQRVTKEFSHAMFIQDNINNNVTIKS